MMFEIYNSYVEPIIIKYSDKAVVLQPNQNVKLYSDCNEIIVKLCHIKNNKFSVFGYLLHELFTLEQMRTVLVVDGEYIVQSLGQEPVIKIKDYEFVFDKKTSYQTFVFSLDECLIQRRHLDVVNENKIITKARWLYLFGGSKTLLPLTGIALLSSLIKILIASYTPMWFWVMTLSLLACFILSFVKYVNSLKFLRKVMQEKYIMDYLLSERKEYRVFSDALAQEYLDVNSGDDMYW